MYKHLLSTGLFVSLLLFSGCDTVNTALNDALPEISVGGGILGLNGETGTDMSGDFAASKTGGIQATATFTLSKTFDDLDTGDITKLRSLSTTLLLAAASGSLITVNRGSATSLPDAITISGGSVSGSVSQAGLSYSLPNAAFSSLGTLQRVSTCAATANACGYVATAGTGALQLASYVLTEAQATQLLAIVAEGSGNPNTVNLSVTMTVSGNDLAGTSATIRVAEYNTAVQADIF